MKINFYNSITDITKYQHKISEKLIRGKSVTSPYRLYKMKQQGINQVIDLRNTSAFKRPFEKFCCKLFKIKYLNFKYSFRLNHLPEHSFFEKINKTIQNNEGITYIHCAHGKRRTGICVAIYEKECLQKSKKEIIDNLLKNGFMELPHKTSKTRKNKKIEKLNNIFNDFLKKYYLQ